MLSLEILLSLAPRIICPTLLITAEQEFLAPPAAISKIASPSHAIARSRALGAQAATVLLLPAAAVIRGQASP